MTEVGIRGRDHHDVMTATELFDWLVRFKVKFRLTFGSVRIVKEDVVIPEIENTNKHCQLLDIKSKAYATKTACACLFYKCLNIYIYKVLKRHISEICVYDTLKIKNMNSALIFCVRQSLIKVYEHVHVYTYTNF